MISFFDDSGSYRGQMLRENPQLHQKNPVPQTKRKKKALETIYIFHIDISIKNEMF